jgi:metal-responsive CopG/Arc/MetJ family transcriptional regulator
MAKTKKTKQGIVREVATVPGLYVQDAEPLAAEDRQKVTVSVNASLLGTIDEYVAKSGANRSAIFDQALLMWCQFQQEQADIAYYSNLSPADKKANESWTRITTEAAKYIWSEGKK